MTRVKMHLVGWCLSVAGMLGCLPAWAALPDCRDIAAIELAVLHDPQRAGDWIDLAYCTLQLGDPASALAMVDDIRSRFDPPEGIQVVLRALRTEALARLQMAQASGVDVRSRWELDWLIGHDSNLNVGPSASSASLTLPAGTIELPLDERLRPQAGRSQILAMRGFLRQPLSESRQGKSQLEWQGEVRYRLAGVDQLNSGQSSVSAAYRWLPAAGVEHRILYGHQLAVLDGQTLLQAHRIEAAQDWGPAALPMDGRLPCRLSVSESIEWLDYPIQPAMNGRLLLLGVGGGCALSGGWFVGGSLRAGVNVPDGERAGGRQRRQELLVTASKTRGFGGDWLLQYHHSRTDDSEGYSPWLNHGVVRDLHRTQWRVEWQRPLTGRWWLLAQAEHQVQSSNLDLFNWSLRAVHVGVRYAHE